MRLPASLNASRPALTALAILLALAGAVLLSASRPGVAQQDPAPSESGQPPAQAAAHRQVAAPGLVEPYGEEREVGSQIIGVIGKMLIEENQPVTANQVLCEIENAQQKAQLAIAKADHANAKADLEKLRNGARAEERREARANLAEAKANLNLARQDYERRKPLTAKGVTPQSDLDQATAALLANEARVNMAAERLALIEAPPRREDVDMATAQVERTAAVVAQAEAELEKTYVRSPIDGVVLRRYRIAGEPVGNMPPTPIAVIGDMSRLRVRAEVDELDVGRVVVGQRVELTADGFPGQRFGGKVFRVNRRMGAKTVQTGRPQDKVDTRVLQVLIDLDPGVVLPVGLRVDAFFLPSADQKAAPKAAAE